MCARYTLTADAAALERRFRVPAPAGHKPRYNLAPGQDAPVLTVEEGSRRLLPLRWGLVPSWAKEKAPRAAPAAGLSAGGAARKVHGPRAAIINARAETLASKPSFQGPLAGRRCLVPADGFYEWKKGSERRPPVRFTLEDGLFAFAGLWDLHRADDGSERRGFTLITVAANPLLAPLHERMPAILAPGEEELWLAPGRETPSLLALLKPYPAERMRSAEASRRVNTTGWDAPDCLTPDDPEPELF
ncbi:MAG: SOS response-associated peptidase [Elusimicrobiota bacterium]|jgi:putative SOS response-associated peptidase YedK